VICALGKTAAIGLGLLQTGDAITRARGQWRTWRGIPAMVTFHPAYLLRQPGEKRKAWQDLQALFPHVARRRSG
jgi:DNA polymerase